ncbi:Aste57867_17199 [Aphanomyces stellatus]|uniref:Aste57867_17199 protein n=1 Tax=Aphanomyces stellatus TaxID=120398 RepID=A0A485L853_9STRA|nr:hypothetical protein As57867_017140 [Aphanomyces stellatus]VFT93956.1 Aste57867_17199 [Aphanomyces stellatus]
MEETDNVEVSVGRGAVHRVRGRPHICGMEKLDDMEISCVGCQVDGAGRACLSCREQDAKAVQVSMPCGKIGRETRHIPSGVFVGGEEEAKDGNVPRDGGMDEDRGDHGRPELTETSECICRVPVALLEPRDKDGTEACDAGINRGEIGKQPALREAVEGGEADEVLREPVLKGNDETQEVVVPADRISGDSDHGSTADEDDVGSKNRARRKNIEERQWHPSSMKIYLWLL